MKIEDLNLSTRAYFCLRRCGIDAVEQLAALSDDDLMKIRGFGIGCLKEVHQKLGRPVVPGPSADNPNIQELCFRNGEQHMKEKVISMLRDVADSMSCITLAQAIKMVEGL